MNAMKNEITERFKSIRKAEGVSQNELIKTPSLASWKFYERGERLPNSDALITLMGMGYSIDWLLSGEGTMQLNNQFEPFNQEIMSEIIIALEGFLNENKKVMKPAKKARLLCALHNHYADQSKETLDQDSVLALVSASI